MLLNFPLHYWDFASQSANHRQMGLLTQPSKYCNYIVRSNQCWSFPLVELHKAN